MKTKVVLLTGLVTLALFTLITGCRKTDDGFYGTISFWNVDLNEDITVLVDNTYTSVITALVDPPYCNYSGTANFYLRDGLHTYYAESSKLPRITWNGSFYIESDCKLFELYK